MANLRVKLPGLDMKNPVIPVELLDLVMNLQNFTILMFWVQ